METGLSYEEIQQQLSDFFTGTKARVVEGHESFKASIPGGAKTTVNTTPRNLTVTLDNGALCIATRKNGEKTNCVAFRTVQSIEVSTDTRHLTRAEIPCTVRGLMAKGEVGGMAVELYLTIVEDNSLHGAGYHLSS